MIPMSQFKILPRYVRRTVVLHLIVSGMLGRPLLHESVLSTLEAK